MKVVKHLGQDQRSTKKQGASPIISEEFWTNWRLEFIANNNEKVRKRKLR